MFSPISRLMSNAILEENENVAEVDEELALDEQPTPSKTSSASASNSDSQSLKSLQNIQEEEHNSDFEELKEDEEDTKSGNIIETPVAKISNMLSTAMVEAFPGVTKKKLSGRISTMRRQSTMMKKKHAKHKT